MRVAHAIEKLKRIHSAAVAPHVAAVESATAALDAVARERDQALANGLDAQDLAALAEIEALPEPV